MVEAKIIGSVANVDPRQVGSLNKEDLDALLYSETYESNKDAIAIATVKKENILKERTIEECKVKGADGVFTLTIQIFKDIMSNIFA